MTGVGAGVGDGVGVGVGWTVGNGAVGVFEPAAGVVGGADVTGAAPWFADGAGSSAEGPAPGWSQPR